MADRQGVPVGSELWLLHFDPGGYGWVPRCHGVVVSVDPELGYQVDGQWYPAKLWPCFSSKEEAERHAAAHPPKPIATGDKLPASPR